MLCFIYTIYRSEYNTEYKQLAGLVDLTDRSGDEVGDQFERTILFAMEVVLGVVLFSKTSIFALDALLRRKGSTQTVPDVVPAPAPAPAPPSTENEAKIQELEEKLAKLKADARAANSPDTFVQYARLKRAANAVEEELSTLKGMCSLPAQPNFPRFISSNI